MASLSLRHICKVYESPRKKGEPEPKPAVSDFCMEIDDKEFIVFVGPSGCGKSTTLRMIAGLEEITSGELYIDDKYVNDDEPKDRDIAMVFQNYALYPHMTVYENMSFGLRMRRIWDIKRNKDGSPVLDKDGNEIPIKRHYTTQEIDEKVMRAADILDINEYLKRKPKALSGGQRQRVALGRAIVRNPKVFLLDEPLSNLDAKLRAAMRTEITKLHSKIQTTFIYVTHDQTEAMTMGTRIVVMKDGFIQQIGTPQEVFDNPANLFVAGFIGTPQMNFFDGVLKSVDGKAVVEIEGKLIEVPELKANGEQKVVIGVRPEHLTICSEDNKGALQATAEVNEMMGSEIYLNISNDEGRKAIIRIPTTELSKEDLSKLHNGATVFYTFKGKLCHIFDPESGLNINRISKQ